MSEEDAITLAKKGDPEAFGALFERHRPLVYARCREMLKNPEEAEDLTQEVWLLVLKKINSFDGRSAFSSWLYKITTNKTLVFIRQRREEVYDLPENGQPPSQQTRLEVLEALEGLGPENRKLVELKFEGYRAKDIDPEASRYSTQKRIRESHRLLREALA